jgi:hypothetical protein
MRNSTVQRALAKHIRFYVRGAARDAAADNRPGAVVGRIIIALVAFALLSGAIPVAIKLAHIT